MLITVLLFPILISGVSGIAYELAYGTKWMRHAGTVNPVAVVIVGDTGLRTEQAILPGKKSSKPIDDTVTIYRKDIGTPTCVWLKLEGDDTWRISQFQVKKEGDDTWYTTGSLDYEFQSGSAKEFCNLKPAVKYSVSIVTSREIGSGTDATVYIILHGKNKEITRMRKMDDPGRDDLERGNHDDFHFRDIDIGSLECIEVRYDETGSIDLWKLDHLEVEIDNGKTTKLYRTESVEDWFRLKLIRKYCDLIEDDPCKCDSVINDNWELTDINYNIKTAKVDEQEPLHVGGQKIENKLSVSQSSQFQVQETVSETKSFTQTYGVEVSQEMSFKTGIPKLGEAEFTSGLSLSGEWSLGSEKSTETAIQAQYNCVAPPKTSVKCDAFLTRYNAEVEYSQTWTHKMKKCSCESGGILKQSGALNLYLSISNIGEKEAEIIKKVKETKDDCKKLYKSVEEYRNCKVPSGAVKS